MTRRLRSTSEGVATQRRAVEVEHGSMTDISQQLVASMKVISILWNPAMLLVLLAAIFVGDVGAVESSSSFVVGGGDVAVIGSHTDDTTFRDARCRIRCLAQLQLNNEISSSAGDYSNDDETLPSASLEDCHSNTICTSCLAPCDRPLADIRSCQENCQNTVAENQEPCSESCQFLHQINAIRPGTCPPETQATGYAAVCATVCRGDADCADDLEHKCCSNSCGWTCQRPSHMHDGTPDVPGPPTTRERFPDVAGAGPESGGVEVSWNSALPNNTGPLLYAVQLQQHINTPVTGGHHTQHRAPAAGSVSKHHGASSTDSADTASSVSTQWLQVTQVVGTSVVLGYDVIKPGRSYQFRVAAVNTYGSQGWSRPSTVFMSTAKPKKPGAPLNVTLGDRMVTDGRISITVHWLPPSTADMTVTRYKLYWSKRSGPQMPSHFTNAHSQSIREYRQVLPSDRLSFTVSSLDPDSTYFFQIQAISQLGDVKLKSERTSVVIETGSHQSQQSRDHGYRGGGSSAVGGMTSPDIDDDDDVMAPFTLKAERPVYENGNLKVNISWSTTEAFGRHVGLVTVQWSPEACIADAQTKDGGLTKVMSSTTADKYYVIHDLRFDCRYVVRVERGSSSSSSSQGSHHHHHGGGHGQGYDSAHLVVSTPSCSQIYIPPGHSRPDCPGFNVMSLVPREPRDLQYSFIISNSNNISARLSWSADDSSPNSVQLIGYRIKWGHVTHTDPIQMDNAALTKVLPKDVKELYLGSLSAATTYVAQVQALGSNGAASHTTSIMFTTPLLQTGINDRPNSDQSNTDHPTRRERPADRRHRRPHDSVAAATHVIAPSSSLVVVTMATPQQQQQRSFTVRSSLAIDLSATSSAAHLVTMAGLVPTISTWVVAELVFVRLSFR